MFSCLSNKSCKSRSRLDGKTAIITGSNTGIGKETAKDFYRRGCRVIMACRDLQKAERAKAAIIEEVGIWCQKKGELICERLDLASLHSVRAFATRMLDDPHEIHILVNNAGVCVAPKSATADGFELQMGVNHLGHFLLTLLLLPRLMVCQSPRIITVSSFAYMFSSLNFDDLNSETRYQPFIAYSNSKLANILFSRELSKRYSGSGLKAYAVHPGIINTEAARYFDSTLFKGAKYCYKKLSDICGKSVREGAQTTIYCCVDDRAGQQTGLHYSNCKVTCLLPKARDDSTAARLWETSLKMVALPSDFNPLQPTNQLMVADKEVLSEHTKL